jgi:hypothetical protein
MRRQRKRGKVILMKKTIKTIMTIMTIMMMVMVMKIMMKIITGMSDTGI